MWPSCCPLKRTNRASVAAGSSPDLSGEVFIWNIYCVYISNGAEKKSSKQNKTSNGAEKKHQNKAILRMVLKKTSKQNNTSNGAEKKTSKQNNISNGAEKKHQNKAILLMVLKKKHQNKTIFRMVLKKNIKTKQYF